MTKWRSAPSISTKCRKAIRFWSGIPESVPGCSATTAKRWPHEQPILQKMNTRSKWDSLSKFGLNIRRSRMRSFLLKPSRTHKPKPPMPTTGSPKGKSPTKIGILKLIPICRLPIRPWSRIWLTRVKRGLSRSWSSASSALANPVKKT